MSSQTISSQTILRFSVWFVVVSCVAAALFLLFGQFDWVRGPAAGIGITAGFVGSGVAAWFAMRSRDQMLIAVALASALPIAFWSWVLYRAMNVNSS